MHPNACLINLNNNLSTLFVQCWLSMNGNSFATYGFRAAISAQSFIIYLHICSNDNYRIPPLLKFWSSFWNVLTPSSPAYLSSIFLLFADIQILLVFPFSQLLYCLDWKGSIERNCIPLIFLTSRISCCSSSQNPFDFFGMLYVWCLVEFCLSLWH